MRRFSPSSLAGWCEIRGGPSLGTVAPLAHFGREVVGVASWRRSWSISPFVEGAAALVALVPARKEEVPPDARPLNPELSPASEARRGWSPPVMADHCRRPKARRPSPDDLGFQNEQWVDVSMESCLQHINIPCLPRKFGEHRSALKPEPRTPSPRPPAPRTCGRTGVGDIAHHEPPGIRFPAADRHQAPSPARFKGDVRRTRTPRPRADAAGAKVGEKTAARFAAMNGTPLGRRPRSPAGGLPESPPAPGRGRSPAGLGEPAGTSPGKRAAATAVDALDGGSPLARGARPSVEARASEYARRAGG